MSPRICGFAICGLTVKKVKKDGKLWKEGVGSGEVWEWREIANPNF
jgi:hypothetical protein